LPKAPGVCRRTSGAPAAAAAAEEEEEEEAEAEEAEAAAAAPPRADVARACAAVDFARCDIYSEICRTGEDLRSIAFVGHTPLRGLARGNSPCDLSFLCVREKTASGRGAAARESDR
jgi:hypothetical protein